MNLPARSFLLSRFTSAIAMLTPFVSMDNVAMAGDIVAPRTMSSSAEGHTLTARVPPGATVQWQRNGVNISGATSERLELGIVTAASAGIYQAVMHLPGTLITETILVGISTKEKVIGAGAEVAADIAHPNGHTFDQILLHGAVAAFTADTSLKQITRLSYEDLNGDIVQVEFSGAGTLSIGLEGATTPTPAANYNQPGTNYVKGHATIMISDADETSNLTIFCVGAITAVNQALFRTDVRYDGYADLALVAIQTANGKFGALKLGNASFWNTKGLTGIYAPGVKFQNEIFVHDINGGENAMAVFAIDGAKETRITGGDLQQDNDRTIQISGLTRLPFTAGSSSHGVVTAAQTNKGRLQHLANDVTAQIVVNP